MRLLHLHDAPHIAGGASAYLRLLIEEAAERGHEQWGWSLDQPIQHPALRGAQSFQYSWPTSTLRRRMDFDGRHAPLVEHLMDWIRTTGPQLIHVQNCAAFRNSVFPALAACGVPILMTVHDFSLAEGQSLQRTRMGLRGWIQDFLSTRAHGRARQNAQEAVSLFLCPTIALLEGLGFGSHQTRVLRLPIARREALPWPNSASNKAIRLFFAGSLYRSKGVDLLLAALTRTSGAASTATLEIAGIGDQAEDLAARTRALGLSPRVRFLGHCDPEAMEAAYARADLLVLPSRVPENSPLTVLEAGARGRPALASGRGGVPELLGEERGWTFRNEDPQDLARMLDELAANPAELRARGERMREWVRQEFDPQAHWDAVEAVRQELSSTGATQ